MSVTFSNNGTTATFTGTGGPLTGATSQLNGATIAIVEGYSSIGVNAFNNATSLTSITIPPRVESIGQQVFQNTTSLTEVTINIDRLGDPYYPSALGSGQGISHSSSNLNIIGYKVFTGTVTLENEIIHNSTSFSIC